MASSQCICCGNCCRERAIDITFSDILRWRDEFPESSSLSKQHEPTLVSIFILPLHFIIYSINTIVL